MKTFECRKRGFSPLVATVLLIAFSVALTTAIINWRGLFLSTNLDDCSNVDFEIEVFDDAQFCYKETPDGMDVDFAVKNIGTDDITGLSIILVGEKGKKLFDIGNSTIRRNSPFRPDGLAVDYIIRDYGKLEKVYFIPSTSSGICSGLLKSTERIKPC